MSSIPKPLGLRPRKRQGRLLAFGMTGAMALGLAACDKSSDSGPTLIVPPQGFVPSQATDFSSTNQPPVSTYVHAGGGGYGGYLGSRGYYPVFGYPGYYYRPAPGTSVEFVTGADSTYTASSPEEARANVARGGFGESAGGEGEGGHGGGEGGHGGGGE